MTKKALIILLVLALIIALVGCSKDTMSEEEMRAQIEAEMKLKEEIRAELEASTETDTNTTATDENDADHSDSDSDTATNDENQTVSPEKMAIVLASKLNVRADSDTSSEVIASVLEKETYEILDTEEKDNGHVWYKIKTADEIEGYIAGFYCMKLSDYENKNGRYHLINAYDGKMDGYDKGVTASRDEIIANLGSVSEEYFSGGELLRYKEVSYLMYGEGMENVNPVAQMSYSGSGTMYGIQKGDTIESVKNVLGLPDFEYTVEMSSELYAEGTLILSYYTGDFSVSIVSRDGSTVSYIELH